MANKVTIDVEARFIDNVTGEARSASAAFGKLEKDAKNTANAIDSIGKKKAQPTLDANTTKFKKAIDDSDKKLSKFGKTKAEAKLSVLDKASAKITSALNKAKSFSSKTYSAMLRIRDSQALTSIRKITSGAEGFAKKTWTAAVKIKDLATAPLRGIKNMLFSIKSLVLAITAGLAAKQLIANPINLADSYSSAKIGFSTLLGESRGQQMMDDLDAFAKKTPFKTSGVIENAQKMMAMGWDPEKIIEDMETIGNAAAATGKMDQGLESIIRAMSQIKTKGKLSTEELNQLAEAGIAAKQMLAENLGYGTGDEGIAKMTEDLEEGAIASNVAIEALLAGMQKYNGMMDSMANETVEGLKSQMADAFEINIVRKWGQGLQDGAKRGLGSVVSLLDEAEEAMSEFGDTLYEVGKTISNWAADKLENTIKRITDITGSFEFKEASLREKISMLWNGAIVDPLKEWWEGGGQQKTAETAGKIGSWMGKMLSKGLLALFGATDVLNDGVGESAGSSIAGSFLQGFLDNFNGQAITDAFVDAIGNVWGALPGWAQLLIGGYAAGKVTGGIGNLIGGVTNLMGQGKNLVGSFDILDHYTAASGGSGLLGLLGKAGAGLGATTTGGALLAGTAGIAGGIAAGVSAIKGFSDIYGSYKSYKAGDELEGKALATSGGHTIGGLTTGALLGASIGSIVPVIGTALGGLIGAGIGGVAGWLSGDKAADNIRKAKYESEEMKAAIADSEKTAEEMSQLLAKAKWENATKHFGDIKLSLTEIQRIADQIVWGDDIASFEQFSSAAKSAEASLQTMKSASEQINRWMWKAGLGVKFNEDEIKSIAASFEEHINSAKAVVENKHYEFTAAVSLLVDVDSEEGKSILDSGNAFYAGLEEQLASLGTQLSDVLNEALVDGVISTDPITLPDGTIQLSEAEEIANLQNQIAEIIQTVSNAEQQAELALIKIKFGQGNLDYESFENFMAQMQTTIDARMQASDDAFVASVSSLNIQLDKGAITQEQYDSMLQTIVQGYTATVESLQANVKDVELNIIGDAYSGEDALGADAVADLNKALQYAIDNGLDPITISDEKMAGLLNIELDNNGETISNIKDMLSGVLSQIDQLEVNGNLLLNVGEIVTKKDIVKDIKAKIPETVEDSTVVKITGESNVSKFDLNGDDFGILSNYSFSPTIRVNPKLGSVGKFMITITDVGGPDGSGYRGGIFGGDSAMEAFARGGRTDNSGIVGGSTRFIRVNEESPEMIIPLSSQRRERALHLFAKTGELLGVPGFARGGSTDGGQDEGIRFHSYGSDSSADRSVHVDLGGVNFTISVNSNDPGSIAEAIKEQAGDLADYIVGMIADSLATEFENTPARGGAA